MKKSELKTLIKEVLNESNEKSQLKAIFGWLRGDAGEYDPTPDKKLKKVCDILGLSSTGTSHQLSTRIGIRLSKKKVDPKIIDSIYKVVAK